MADQTDQYSIHTHSYLLLRKTIGWIGVLLPFILLLGNSVIFKDCIVHRSISFYYHTGMGDVFVGAICAVGLFMFFYAGYDKLDNRLGNLAGLFAIALSLFRTTPDLSYGTDLIGWVHLICAALFFLILAYFSMFQFTKTKEGEEPTSEKKKRNVIYKVCGHVMVACLIAMFIYIGVRDEGSKQTSFVFWAETIALVAFGISWLTKGETLYRDREVEIG